MKRFTLMLTAFIVTLVFTGCGVPTEEHEAVQASAAALTGEKQALETKLADTEAKLEAANTQVEEYQQTEADREKAKQEKADREAKEKAEKEAAAKAEKAKANKAKTLTARELAKIVKKPDSFVDKNVTVYAKITQFDSATGPCIFRADISNARVGKYDFEHNSMFVAGDGVSNCKILDDFVSDDIVKITATVTGSLSYDTQIGGSTTVPKFEVVKIKRS